MAFTTRAVGTDFHESAPIRFTATRRIAQSPDTIFAALADTPTWSQWFPAVARSEWTSEPPFGVGSTRRVKTGGAWIDEEFNVWEPGRRWGFVIVSTPLPIFRAGAELATLDPDGDATRVTYTMFLDPYPYTGPVVRAARRGVEKGLRDGLKGLDRHLAATA